MERRKYIQSIGAAVGSVGLLSTATHATQNESQPSWLEQVREYRRAGQQQKAVEILEQNKVLHGITGTIRQGQLETDSQNDVKGSSETGHVSTAQFGKGPFAKPTLQTKQEAAASLGISDGSSDVGTEDYYRKSKSSSSVMAYYVGEETVNGDTFSAFEGQTSASLVRNSSDFNVSSVKPADVIATTFEGSWWMPREKSVRSGNPYESPGEVKDIQDRSDGITAEVLEPSQETYTVVLEFKLLMHPNAEGAAQLYGHYGHTWQTSPFGTIGSISVGKGLLQIGMNMDGGKWIVDTPGLLVNDTCDNQDPDWCSVSSG